MTAVFKPIPYTLEVSISPDESGSVSAVNIDCPDDCVGQYYIDTEVALTATPEDGYSFDHWEKDLSGSDNPETLTMDSDKEVTAVFIKLNTLTVSISPAGGGSVSA